MLRHSRNDKAEIIHIASLMARRNTQRASQLTMESDQINQTITCPQLHKSTLIKFPHLVTAPDLAMKASLAVTRVKPQHNVIYSG